MFSRNILHIEKKLKKSSIIVLFQEVKVHHGTAYKQGHERNPHSFTDQEQ